MVSNILRHIINVVFAKGGEGVFREFVEVIIGEEQLRKIISKVYLMEQ